MTWVTSVYSVKYGVSDEVYHWFGLCGLLVAVVRPLVGRMFVVM